MMHPWTFGADAMLEHVASWGDRDPHKATKFQPSGFVKSIHDL
jgi:hypothetical protein